MDNHHVAATNHEVSSSGSWAWWYQQGQIQWWGLGHTQQEWTEAKVPLRMRISTYFEDRLERGGLL